jgi:hypothetical protein
MHRRRYGRALSIGWIPLFIIACLRQVVAFAPKVIKSAYGAIMNERRNGRRDCVGKGVVYMSMKLMKQKKKGRNCAVFCFAGKRIFFYIYDVITWEKIHKRSIYYFCG